jgi:hypothetical protein
MHLSRNVMAKKEREIDRQDLAEMKRGRIYSLARTVARTGY